MIFYVLCNFSYCLHHSFLTGLLGLISGCCGPPPPPPHKIRDTETVCVRLQAGHTKPVLEGGSGQDIGDLTGGDILP